MTYCYPQKQKKHFLSLTRTMVLTPFKSVQQVTGTEKTESNHEEENKSVEFRQTEYIMKVITGGDRSQLIRWFGVSEKICHLELLIN